VGNFGVTEILIVLGVIVVLFGIPRRAKLRRNAANRLDKTKDALGDAKGEFMSGLRDEPREAVVPDPVTPRQKRWGRRSR
jgi:Sec-independent protein translocase protein TatA